MKNMNTNYDDIITHFVLNKLLHHVGMSWIIEKNQQLEYEIDKHDPDLITGGPQYNTFICKNFMEDCLKILLDMQDKTNIVSCVLSFHMIKNNLRMSLKKAVLEIG